jgi:hypothetical protein
VQDLDKSPSLARNGVVRNSSKLRSKALVTVQ